MQRAMMESWKSLLKLFRFLLWYAIAVVAILYLLPMAARIAEDRYEAMSSTVRLFSVVGFFATVAVWQVMSMRKRIKERRASRRAHSADDAQGTAYH